MKRLKIDVNYLNAEHMTEQTVFSRRRKSFLVSVYCRMIFLLCMLFLLYPGRFYAEAQTNLSLKLQDVPLEQVLSAIEMRTDYHFLYSKEQVDVSRKVSIDIQNKDLAEALSQLFAGTDITYTLKNKQIVLTRSSVKESRRDTPVKTVSGIVRDEKGEPVIGANIIEKGVPGNGTITNAKGQFSLKVSSDAVLQISYIGYLPLEVSVKGVTSFDIVLKEDTQMIDEVVVVGYGTQKKVNLTGAVSVVRGEEMTKRPITNVTSMLQAQIPGLRVVNGSGQSGNNKVSLRVRGQGTYSNAGSDPLVLINGVPGELSSIDPNAIESISVLKDAASAAVYGARAANGVVLVTTKTGIKKTSISYSGNFAIYSPTRMLKVITNSVDYMNLWNEAKTNSGISSGLYPQDVIDLYKHAKLRGPEYPNYNWLGEHIHSNFSHNHNIAVSGGSDKMVYNVSMYYADENGTMDGHGYKKYNFTADLQSQITKWMKFGSYVGFMRGDRKRPYEGGTDGSFTSIFAQAPTYAPRRTDGSWVYKAYPWESNNKNVIALVGNDALRKNTNYDVNAQAWLTIDIAKGLSWHTKGAVRMIAEREKEWRPLVKLYNYHTGEYMNELDVGAKGLNANNYHTFYTYLYSYLKYDVVTKDQNHNFGFQLGYSQETNDYDWLKGYRKDFPFPLTEIDAGSKELQEAEGNQEQWSLMGIFGRFNYNYKERYLFEANFRYDGSSRINPDDRWGIFPSFSTGWRITEEKFMQDISLSWLNNLKIRASWGQLGNQNIGVYPYQAVMENEGNYTFDNSSLSTGYAQTKYANKNITWEMTAVTDIGLDAMILNGLSVTFDWYKKKTKNVLRNAQVTGTLGLEAPVINSGEMENKGFELNIQYLKDIKSGSFKGLTYNVGFYFDRNRNKVTKFGSEEISGYYLRKEGLPYNSYYMLDCIGVFRDKEDVKRSPKQFNDNTLPGDLKYRDVNNDGVIDNTDRIVIDGRFPKFEYAVNLSAAWKGFDVFILMQGVEGKKHYVTDWGLQPFRQGSAPTIDYVKHRWTEEKPDNAKYPRMYFDNFGGSKNTRRNSYFLKDASYFRLKNVTIGYVIPSKLTRKWLIQKIRVFFSGDNLATITNYPELDPEREEDGRFVAYPQNRICSFGINIQF
ncbi:TonB-dependent receptor [Tannerella sp.]|uniref:TonB-dependent receptor n=1 Tax=Tannerella sp. TaxID=2382127 RepID=UPI0026DAC453|nr:TonB-dependent receptor [Tannerella sp.]MDO4702787.1 TonB-dependent receptor [Tannerella sp.]